MKSQQRVPFGSEANLEIINTTCPGCNINRGNYHAWGCPVERCPEFGGRLLKCSCMVLSLPDEFKLCTAIAKTLNSDHVLKMTEGSKILNQTYEERGAFSWIIENAPPQIKVEMNEKVKIILGAKKHGDHFHIPVNKAAEALGMSEEEAEPIMRDLEADCLYPDWEKQTSTEQ